MLNVQIVSKVYDNHSLSIVTRKLVLELVKTKKVNISIVPLDKYNPDAKVTREERSEEHTSELQSQR